jgi:hypothetical protein
MPNSISIMNGSAAHKKSRRVEYKKKVKRKATASGRLRKNKIGYLKRDGQLLIFAIQLDFKGNNKEKCDNVSILSYIIRPTTLIEVMRP